LPQVLVNLKVAVSETNVVTSVFSGTGGFECSVKWVLDSINNIVCKSSAEVPLVCYSATELAHHAQKALMAHDITTRPLHIFPDIMDRLYDTDKQRIMSIKQNHKTSLDQLIASHAEGVIDADELDHQKRRLQKSILREMLLTLSKVEFKEMCHCIVHDCCCYVNPHAVPEYATSRWTECGGNVCTSWSRFGKHLGWLDEGGMSALVWVFSAKYYGPHTLLQECTPDFDSAVFTQILCEASPDSPRSLYGLSHSAVPSAGAL
jgi:hypothetical protein